VRAARLVELLLLLQIRGRASAAELAEQLEVSVRTIYRDIGALGAAGVPVFTETGRNGGIRLSPGYRVGGLPELPASEAGGLLLAAVPAAARQLGLAPDAGAQKVLASMDVRGEAAALAVRERVLVEPEPWWTAEDDAPLLPDVARAVWDEREARITYRDREQVVRPLGLVLKAGTWYLIARRRSSATDRVYRLARVSAVDLLPHHFERPADFDLRRAWRLRKDAFAASIPTYFVTVRVGPGAVDHLHLFQEGAPAWPPPDDVERDRRGWITLRLRFERPETACQRLLQLGADVEVVDPPELRARMADVADRLRRVYRKR